jgi:hypothetical protein
LCGNDEAISLLLETGNVDVNTITHFGTPLMLAVRTKHQGALKILLETKKVNMNQKHHSGMTATAMAAMEGDQAVFDILSEYGKPFNLADDFKRTPLFYAIKGGNYKIVESILSHPGVSVIAKDSFGALPLSVAARIGDTKSAALLLRKNGAVQLRTKDRFGRSPLAWATFRSHNMTRDFLLRKCQEEGIFSTDEIMFPVVRRTKRGELKNRFCDICFVNTGYWEPFYTCPKCWKGTLIVCRECRLWLNPKPGCLQNAHRLILRKRNEK